MGSLPQGFNDSSRVMQILSHDQSLVCQILKPVHFVCVCVAMTGFSSSMWDLVSWPGIEPVPPALEARSLNWQFLKIREQWSLLPLLTLPLKNEFSVACKALWWHFVHCRASFKIGMHPLKPCLCFINGVYMIFSIFCCHFNSFTISFPEADSISRRHFHCSSIRSYSPTISSCITDCSDLVTSPGSTSNSGSLVVSTISAVANSITNHWS